MSKIEGSSAPMREIGVVGLGQMGLAIARSLANRGVTVTAFDRNPLALAGAASEGLVEPATSAQAVARVSKVVVVSVYAPSDARQVIVEPEVGLLAGLSADSMVLDTTTNTPAIANEVGAACQAKGVHFLCCPVSGRAPRLTVMVGAELRVYNRAVPILNLIADRVFYLGSWEAACIAKHVNQFLTYTNYLAAAEGLAAASAAGVPLETLCSVLDAGSGNSMMLRFAAARALHHEPPVPPAPLRLVGKDARLALECLESVGLKSALLSAMTNSIARVEAQAADRPFVELYDCICRELVAPLKLPL